MKTTVNAYQFRDAFQAIRPDNFSYNGLSALFDYLEDFENDTGQEIELDVIAICCDYSEYKSLDEVAEQYGEQPEDIENYTTVISFDGGVIIQNW